MYMSKPCNVKNLQTLIIIRRKVSAISISRSPQHTFISLANDDECKNASIIVLSPYEDIGLPKGKAFLPSFLRSIGKSTLAQRC